MRLLSGTVLLCLALSAAFAAAPPAKVPPAWLALIDQLGDDNNQTQNDASKKLEALGEDVLPALRRAENGHDDVDVRLRCKLLITAIEKNEYREVRQFVGHTDGVHSIAVSPDGKRLVSGSWYANREPVARTWDVRTGKAVLELKVERFGVHAVDFSPDGKHILTGGGDSTLRLWDASTGKQLEQANARHVVLRVRSLPDGKRAIACVRDEIVVWWLGTKGVKTIAKTKIESIRDMALLPGGKGVVVVGTSPNVRLFDLETHKEVHTFVGHDGWVTGVAVAPDGKLFVTAGHDRTARLWDAEKGEEVRQFIGHTGRVLGVAWSNDGRRVITTSDDRTARVWEADSGKLIQRLEGFTGDVTCARFLPGDRFVVVGSYDKTLRLWKIRP